MTDREWLDGLVVASREYYKTGSLDFGRDFKYGSYPLGEWVQWNRENYGTLSVIQINDLMNYGMIWNEKVLGNHDKFKEMYPRYKREYKSEWSENIEFIKDVELKEWAKTIIEYRNLFDNAFLTMREIDMLNEVGFPWTSKQLKYLRAQEDARRKEKYDFLITSIRNGYLELVDKHKAENDEANSRTGKKDKDIVKEKPIIKEKIVEKEKIVVKYHDKHWSEELAYGFIKRDKKIKKKYLDTLQYRTLNNDEKELLRFINTPNWLIDELEITDSMTVADKVKELNTYMKYMRALGYSDSELLTFDSLTFGGYNVAKLLCDLMIVLTPDETGYLDLKLRDKFIIEFNKLSYKSISHYINKEFTGKSSVETHGETSGEASGEQGITSEYVNERKKLFKTLEKEEKNRIREKEKLKNTELKTHEKEKAKEERRKIREEKKKIAENKQMIQEEKRKQRLEKEKAKEERRKIREEKRKIAAEKKRIREEMIAAGTYKTSRGKVKEKVFDITSDSRFHACMNIFYKYFGDTGKPVTYFTEFDGRYYVENLERVGVEAFSKNRLESLKRVGYVFTRGNAGENIRELLELYQDAFKSLSDKDIITVKKRDEALRININKLKVGKVSEEDKPVVNMACVSLVGIYDEYVSALLDKFEFISDELIKEQMLENLVKILRNRKISVES